MPGPGGNNRYLDNLQVLRFVAAFMVLLSHVRHEAATSAGEFGTGWSVPFDLVTGVDIFFVISGFVMYFLCHDRFGRPGESLRFLQRRAIRLIPTYWIFTAMMLMAAQMFRSQLANPDFSVAHVLASLAFIPWPDLRGEIYPPLIVGWTLNYEALFYVVFAGALLLPKRIGLLALFASFGLAAAMHGMLPDDFRILRFWSDPIILEFLMGIALAALFLQGARLSRAAGLSLAIAGFGLLCLFYQLGWQQPDLRFIWAGLPAFLVCAGLALSDMRTSHNAAYRLLVLCGSASYALYLSHLFTVKLIGALWRKFALGMPWLYLATACGAAVFISVIIYLAVEMPMLTWISRRIALRKLWATVRRDRAAAEPQPDIGVEPVLRRSLVN